MTRTDWLESLGPGDTVVLVSPHLRSALDPKSGLLPVQICVVDIDKIVLGATGMERAWIVWRDGGFYNHDSQCWYIQPVDVGPDYPNPLEQLEAMWEAS